MRIRTLVLGGAAAAFAAYLLDPRQGRTRRDRIRAIMEALFGRWIRPEPPAPLPQNLAPTREVQPERTVTTEPEHGPDSIAAEAHPVIPPRRELDDATIVGRVRTKLDGRRDLRTDDLVVDVVNRVVYLSGKLHDRQTFGEIVDLTSEVPGVRRVQSLLHLPDSETLAGSILARQPDDANRSSS